ncbi:MAG: 50S ribosomal protein L18 [bacterium]
MTPKMSSEERRKKKHKRVRKKVSGRPSQPRLFVYKSNNHIYAQLIDDFRNETLTAASSLSPEIRDDYDRGNCEAARAVGELIAEKAEDMNIDTVVFDRGGYPYHGRVKAVAEGARDGGLEF